MARDTPKPHRVSRMSSSTTPGPGTHPVVRHARWIALVIGIAAVVGTVALVVLEDRWDARNQPQPTPDRAFVNGSIGTELAPLVVFEVLPELFPEEFHPIDTYLKSHQVFTESAGDWVDQYGFVRKSLAPEPRDGTDLPVGFVLSYHRPGSGAGSPVPFVGLSCAACHSGEVRLDPGRPGKAFHGIGNPAMNLLAFSEAVRGLLLRRADPKDPRSDYLLTVAAVKEAQARRGRSLDGWEVAMTGLWLRGARAETGEYQRVIDEPYRPHELMDPRFMMAGPNRTQPFRSLVRIHSDRPGWSLTGHQMDQGFSKVPAVYHQDHRFHGEWAQFDGTVRDLVARSALAASTAGGNVHNLSRPDIASHIQGAAEYTRDLAPPAWKDVFPDHPLADRSTLERGRTAYHEHCYHCHGGPDGKGGWAWDANDPKNRFGTVVPLDRLGTDQERIKFRHAEAVARRVSDRFGADFRKKHPLATFKWDEDPNKTDIRTTNGYYAGPIAGSFLRAPYLHNASVLTLAELIGRKPRRDKFYRGRNAYDPDGVGLVSPDVPNGVDRFNPKPHDRHYYFLFDTAERGNSHKGHEYPAWGNFHGARKLTAEQEQELSDLLAYLKTL